MEFSGRFILHLSSSLVAGVSENSPWPWDLRPLAGLLRSASGMRVARRGSCYAAQPSPPSRTGFVHRFAASLPPNSPSLPLVSLSLSLCVPPSPLNLASSLEARTYFYCQRSVQLWTPAWSAACFRCRASGHQSSQYSVGVRRQFLGMVLGRTSVLGPRPST